MPRTENQYKEIRENRKKKILNAALRLFAMEGYHQTSISKIAKEAGISKGLLYNYFESKEDLLLKVVEDASADVYKYFDPNHDGMLEQEEMKYFIHNVFRVFRENYEFWKLYLSMAFNPQVMELLKNNIPVESENLIGVINDYFKRRGVEDPMSETIYFSSVLKGMAIQYIITPEYFPLEMMEKKLIEQFCE
ncbi:MAG: TetR/AcrR family transcriptional regulator [Bacteroidota bacterium]